MVVPSSGFALSYLVSSSPSLTRYVPRTPGCVDNDDQKIRKTNILVLVFSSRIRNLVSTKVSQSVKIGTRAGMKKIRKQGTDKKLSGCETS